MTSIFFGLFIVGCVIAVALALVKRKAPTPVLEEKLAALDRVIAARGLDADIFVDAQPIEIAVRGSRAPDGLLSLNAIGTVEESLKRLSSRARPVVRGGVLRLAIDESGVEQWTDEDVERIATDIYTLVSALKRRAAAELRASSKPNPRPEAQRAPVPEVSSPAKNIPAPRTSR